MLIGILENVVGFYVSPAYKEGVALVLFLGVILFRPEGLLGNRGAQGMNTQRKTLLLIAGLAIVVVAALFAKRSEVYLLTLTCVYLMATFGLNLTVGYAGQMSLGQAAFFGIGAYIAAIAMKAGVPFLVVLPIAAVACFAVGLALGFPALRVQHHYLAFATLGFNVLIFLIMRNEEKITGGTFGISAIPRPSLFGYELGGALPFFFFTFVSLIFSRAFGGCFALRATVFVALIIRSASKLAVTAHTLLAFAIGAACAGVGGVYYAVRNASRARFISPRRCRCCSQSSSAARDVHGPVVGTIIIILLPEFLRSSNVEWLKFMQKWYLAFGVAVIARMIWLPGGILSFSDRFKERQNEFLSRSQGRAAYGRSRPWTGQLQCRAWRDRRRDRPQRFGQDDAFNSILGQIDFRKCGLLRRTSRACRRSAAARRDGRSRRAWCSSSCRFATT